MPYLFGLALDLCVLKLKLSIYCSVKNWRDSNFIQNYVWTTINHNFTILSVTFCCECSCCNYRRVFVACFNLPSDLVCFSPHRNMLLCSSVWMPPLCLKKSYAMPNPFHSSGIVPDLLCKYSTFIFLSQLFVLVRGYLCSKNLVFCSLESGRWLFSCLLFLYDQLCLLLQHQRRFCGSQSHLSTRDVPAAAVSLQRGEGGGGWRRLPFALPPLPAPTSPPPSFTHTGNHLHTTIYKSNLHKQCVVKAKLAESEL